MSETTHQELVRELVREAAYQLGLATEELEHAEAIHHAAVERKLAAARAYARLVPPASAGIGEPQCSDPDCLICRPIGMDE